MKQLVMTIGLPYSGKSEAVKALAQQGYQVIERDVILQEVTASSVFKGEVQRRREQRPNEEIFAIRNEVQLRCSASVYVVL